ncbi:acyltransferase family protein [Hyphococcus sp.]|uniref:acyltransferase family protein n=1 Tax=Hyphococcus sp. TaxID=2038636 RepID=UPI0035C7432A
MEGRYYEAIDGLRAVAVLLVLFFHAGFGFAEGGFVGVDVFFVISGFLITGMIARDIERKEWSFSRFYLRRIARLTPALLVTIIATLVAGYFILAPEDLARLGRTGSYAAVSGSNIFFWLESGYFDQASSSKPLLHTWSLGVEEQYYLVWPALVFLFAKLGGRKAIAWGLAALGVLSLCAAVYLNGKNPGAVFFLMPFRIHQFALGGLIALTLTLKGGRLQSLSGLASVLMLLAAGNLASGDGGAYWLNAVLPAVAAALFIWSSEAAPVKAVFASPPMRMLGRWSYSIYLVHWPIMVLWPLATDFELSAGEGVVACIISLAAGAALYYFVETPFRFTSEKTPRARGWSLAGTAVMFGSVLFAGAHLWALDGFPGRMNAEFKKFASMKHEWDRRQNKLRMGVCNISKDAPLSSFNIKTCATPPDDGPAYMIIGDSYGADAYLILSEAYPDVYFGQMTLPGCLLTGPETMTYNKKWSWCAKFYKRGYAVARKNGFDGVIFASAWPAERAARVDDMLRWAEENSLDAILFSDRTRFKQRVPAIVTSSLNRAQAQRRATAAEIRFYEMLANSMEKNYGDKAKVVNMRTLLCEEDGCPIFDGESNVLYLDESHISLAGAHWAAQRMRAQHGDLFRK